MRWWSGTTCSRRCLSLITCSTTPRRPSSRRRPLRGGDGDAGTWRRHGGVSEPARDGPHDVLIFALCIFFLPEPETCVLLGRHSNHLSYSTWLMIGWLFCNGILPIAWTRLWYHLLTLAIRRTMSTKNWLKVSSKEKLTEVKGERVRDSLRFAEDSIFIFLNGLNNKSNYKNRKTNYTNIEKWTNTSPKLAKKWHL